MNRLEWILCFTTFFSGSTGRGAAIDHQIIIRRFRRAKKRKQLIRYFNNQLQEVFG